MTYPPVLNTILLPGFLSEHQADLEKARVIYSKALLGYDKVFGPDNQSYVAEFAGHPS
jgi:hypothetical protein